MFQKYSNGGIATIPLRGGIPQVEWSKYFEAAPSESDYKKWDSDGHKEYALLCGKVSGIIAVDIDIDDTSRIYSLAGETQVRKKGSKGFTAFYRYNGEQSANWKNSSGEVICELLSNKRLTTIPPSPHRKTGKPYVWLDADIMGAKLPPLNEDFILLMDAKYPKQKQFSISPPREVGAYEDIRLHDAERMLTFIDSNCNRDEWIQIGMALRDEYGDAACHVWHNWSSKSTKYNHNAAQACWRSFTGGGVTIATLVYYAKRGGWIPEQSSVALTTNKQPKKVDAPQQVIVGGLVGDIANWITSTAIRPQPELSLAAALSVVSAIKGHRVQSSMREARTNLLILSLAPTGGGKDHPQYAAQKLLKACGLERVIMGRPTSGTALLTGLNKAACIGWLKVDEFGRYLANASGKQAQSHQREIVDYMIELYTCANRTFYGRQYANDKENPQIVLEQPHFCCLGSTVEEKMREACKSSEVIDGFLNRWLVFNSHERPKKNLTIKDYNPPQWLIDKVLSWLSDFPIRQDSYGCINPTTIELTPEAWDKFVAYEAKIEKLIETVGYPVNELYARAGEHVIKIATTLTDDLWVGTGEIDSAIAITDRSIHEIVQFASGIADNQHQQNVIFVLDIIRRSGESGIGKNEITQKTRRLNNKERSDILNQLIEAEDIAFDKDGKKVIFRAV